MYYIRVKYYQGKNFVNEHDEELYAITTDDVVEAEPVEEGILWFETAEEAKNYFNTNWALDDIENDIQDSFDVQSARYIVQNDVDPSYYEVIAQATYIFKVDRF